MLKMLIALIIEHSGFPHIYISLDGDMDFPTLSLWDVSAINTKRTDS